VTQTDNDALADLRDMLEDVDREEDCTVFNHTPEEIWIEVMKNHEAILAALRSTPQPKPAQRYPNEVMTLAKAATDLVTATNGREDLRPPRLAVLLALKGNYILDSRLFLG